MRVLVTGGAGYIGSHTVVALLDAGHEVIIIDNLCNSSVEALDRVAGICGRRPEFFKLDLRNRRALDDCLETLDFAAVIHFAGLKAVGESVAQPLAYYENNLCGTLNLLQAMAEHGVKNLVFSSSATVYGDPRKVPITEEAELGPTNPYGRTKLMIEEILKDLWHSDESWNIILLRYFNPIGAHASGCIGEDPSGIPNNLLPYVSQVAVGRRPEVAVFGDDYDTVDGTGVRDYIHVVDLAAGHLRALEKIGAGPGLLCCNLGTGRGYSVLEVIKTFAEVNGVKVPYRIAPRRPGDIAVCYADPSLAARVLGWRAERDLRTMCADAWNWQARNPEGYGGKE
ncbi:MAG: UDP-glucose 4-epimerase GalE [Deltaproteobacteria bacterium]|nr:UDP-glucose 4-epimerase GalE [Deltaproteobacteria bacterium]